MARLKIGEGITFEAELPRTKSPELLSQKRINVLLSIGLVLTTLLHFI